MDGTTYDSTILDLSHKDCAIAVQMENNGWIKSGADCNHTTVDYVVCEQMATDGMLSEHYVVNYKNYFKEIIRSACKYNIQIFKLEFLQFVQVIVT